MKAETMLRRSGRLRESVKHNGGPGNALAMTAPNGASGPSTRPAKWGSYDFHWVSAERPLIRTAVSPKQRSSQGTIRSLTPSPRAGYRRLARPGALEAQEENVGTRREPSESSVRSRRSVTRSPTIAMYREMGMTYWLELARTELK